jgi:hypothetical protein
MRMICRHLFTGRGMKDPGPSWTGWALTCSWQELIAETSMQELRLN